MSKTFIVPDGTKFIHHGMVPEDATECIIPNTVSMILDNAFMDCSSLTSVVIPDSVTSIGKGAFYGCSGLTSVVIPDSVSIGYQAFHGCTSLTNN